MNARSIARLRARYIKQPMPRNIPIEDKDRVSLPLKESVWLWRLLGHCRPKSIADVGSGFSSLLFRAWGADVTSVDHDRWFLGSVGRAVKAEGLPKGRFAKLEDFLAEKSKYDLVFVDHGPTMKDRADDFGALLKRVTENGIIVFDDFPYPVEPNRYFQQEVTLLLDSRPCWKLRNIRACRLGMAKRCG